ncbi:competence protein ComEC [Paraperlucidibaca baekdonensis]|uniref:Competence protein ComEC n=1 Tax=Paraperlucidibaca baekdonensis TaxID=748120 RepID=A0A3E0H5T6_9GAMM|nr:DNA internalization-related competence protein ComEC/Rec2 [Paraperlucidibaca baekdonensis]REH38902.1 competence protein ComEC [Paraperlucidibaca baekdonensis]
MSALLLSSIFGVFLLRWWVQLPDVVYCLGFFALMLSVCLCYGLRRLPLPRAVLMVTGLSAGLYWSVLAASTAMQAQLPAACEGQRITVSGRIIGLPRPAEPVGERFVFAPQSGAPSCWQPGVHWQLSWRGETVLRPDQHWQFHVRLKRPNGVVNPGGFDGELWWHQSGISATGWASHGELIAPAGITLDGLRWRIRQHLLAAFPEQPDAAGTVLALLTGDRAGMSAEAWDRYARTGITHLVAISGVHITMVAWLVAWCLRWLWLRSPRLALWLPAARVSGVMGWLAACGYGVLAGMEVPTQRTLLMLGMVVWLRYLPGEMRAAQSLVWALAAVLLIDPLAIHSAGLWLSFAAVALLMAGGMAPGEEVSWRAGLRAQWLATWGLLPLSLALFSRLAWLSLLVNIIAIPWVTFSVVPVAMAGLLAHTVSETLGHALWTAAIASMATLDALLKWFAALPAAALDWHVPGLSLWALVLSIALLLMPRALPGRSLAWLPLLALLWPQPLLQPGQLRLSILDVGQGLAVHAQTAEHELLFDTGAAWQETGGAGQRIILPYMRWAQVRALDALVFSHDDNDHTGGGAAIMRALPVAQVWGDWPSPLEHWPLAERPPVQACRQGQRWQWDGVTFEFLWPAPAFLLSRDNERSCVLRIRAQGFSVLIPADLEAQGELTLLSLLPAADVRADLLLLGHHGSKTSTTASWLAAVAPREVIATVGYRNRFRHPHPSVQQRVLAAGQTLWRSDSSGMLRYEFLHPGQWPTVQQWRQHDAHYWRPRRD